MKSQLLAVLSKAFLRIHLCPLLRGANEDMNKIENMIPKTLTMVRIIDTFS
ncbi:hypothetical protein KFK09_028655 [Dendrobium nobile]|uniref:Uncharacterized protein n=1 Tax=Dendrobium nobile TaxID=94219 RepID=A0A8T3A380_DENNO|nr:hypothetical protein KFK09_028655 [Dendrobium nobile]